MGAVFVSVCLILACVVLDPVVSLDISNFYPYGLVWEDQALEPGDDISSNEIRLEENVVFYNTSYRTIYVSIV